MRLNLGAVLHVTHAYLGAMVDEGWGRVVTIVSDAGRKGERIQAIYGAAKAGAMGFIRGIAAEVGAHGVTANCVSLGTMKTGPTEAARARTPTSSAARAGPTRSPGSATPDDVAPLVALLCSDAGAGSPARCIRSTAATSPRCNRRARDHPGCYHAGRHHSGRRGVRRAMPVDPVVSHVAGVTVVLLWQPRAGARRPRRVVAAPRAGAARRLDANRPPNARARPGNLRRAAGRHPSGARSCSASSADTRPTHLRSACSSSRLVSVLGIFSNVVGPVGDGIDAAASIMLGAGRVVVPLALLVAAGGVLVASDGDDGESRSDLRLGLGIVLVCAAIVGLLHIGHGNPDGDALEPLQHAGGLLGALIGAPLARAARRGRRGHRAGRGPRTRCAARVRCRAEAGRGDRVPHTMKWLAEHGKGLFTLQPVPLDDTYEPDRPLLYDQVADELDTSIGPLPEADIDLVEAEDSVEKVTEFSSTDEVLDEDVEISLSEGEDEDEDAEAAVDGELPDVGVEAAAGDDPQAQRVAQGRPAARRRPAARSSKQRCASSASTPASSARPSARPSRATSSSSRRA